VFVSINFKGEKAEFLIAQIAFIANDCFIAISFSSLVKIDVYSIKRVLGYDKL
jgi:hypothetical protein